MSQTEAAQILDKPIVQNTPPTQNEGGAVKDEGIPPATEKVSSKLEILIKREQAALFRERLAKQKEAELESKMQAFEEREARIKEFEGAKGNSKKALELLGLNYDELTRSQLADGEIPPDVQIKKIEEKFDAFKTAKEQEDQQRAEEQKRLAAEQEQTAISNFKTEINTYLKDNTARYELIAFENQEQLVFDVIDEHYNRTLNTETGIGKVMNIKEAADKVEEYLEQKEIKRKELNKTKAIWAAVPKASLQEAAKPQANQRTPIKTLTNQLSARVQTPTTNRVISDEERVQKAIAYAKGLRP